MSTRIAVPAVTPASAWRAETRTSWARASARRSSTVRRCGSADIRRSPSLRPYLPPEPASNASRAVAGAAAGTRGLAGDGKKSREDGQPDQVEDQLVIELDRAEDVFAARPRAPGDEADGAEDQVGDQRGHDDGEEHE